MERMTKEEYEESIRCTLRGNTFVTIPAGTIVVTDDPKFPVARLQEDLRVCSNAHALVVKVADR